VKDVLILIVQDDEVTPQSACALHAIVAIVEKPLVVGAVLHTKVFHGVIVRLLGGQSEDMESPRHHCTPAPLTAFTLAVDEVRVHDYDANPLKRTQTIDLLVVPALSTTMLLLCGGATTITVSKLPIVALAAAFEEQMAGCRRGECHVPRFLVSFQRETLPEPGEKPVEAQQSDLFGRLHGRTL